MTQSKLTLENFLKEEETQANAFLATIKADKNDKNNVKITPWNKEGCNCSNSLSVEKSAIESVEKTEHTHYCCGQNHTVVKVNFKKNASIVLEDAFKQLASKVHSIESHGHFDNILADPLPDSLFPPDGPTGGSGDQNCRFSEIQYWQCPHGPNDTRITYRANKIYRNRQGFICRVEPVGKCH